MLKHILISKLFDLDLLEVALGKYKLTESQQMILEQKLKLLDDGVPLDYLIGKVKLLDLDLIVNKYTLIPRQETEFWLQQFRNNVQNNRHLEQVRSGVGFSERSSATTSQRSYASIDNNFKASDFTISQILVDLGTGTGVIGTYLSDIYERAYLLDIDPKTLEVTKQNITLNQKTNCQAILSYGLEKIKHLIDHNQKWDLVANLPYLPIQDIARAKEYKVEHEPALALYSGQDGLELFDKVLEQIKIMQNKPVNIIFELDPRNIQQAKTSLNQLSYKTEIWLDQNGLDRVLVGALTLS